MDIETFKATRKASGLSQALWAEALNVSRATVAKIEGGKLAISGDVEARARALEGKPAPQKVARIKPAPRADLEAMRQARAYDFATAPDHVKGLRRLPESNVQFFAAKSWDTEPAAPGWQRIPGCIVKCHNAIPSPIPFQAPRWAGPRGVVTQSGAVFHQITGLQMKRAGAAPMTFGQMGTAPAKGTPKAKRRRSNSPGA